MAPEFRVCQFRTSYFPSRTLNALIKTGQIRLPAVGSACLQGDLWFNTHPRGSICALAITGWPVNSLPSCQNYIFFPSIILRFFLFNQREFCTFFVTPWIWQVISDRVCRLSKNNIYFENNKHRHDNGRYDVITCLTWPQVHRLTISC